MGHKEHNNNRIFVLLIAITPNEFGSHVRQMEIITNMLFYGAEVIASGLSQFQWPATKETRNEKTGR